MKKSTLKNASRVAYSLFLIITFLGVSFLVNACKEKNDDLVLSVSPTHIKIPAVGGKSYFTIETNASSWQVSNPDPDRILLSDEEGSTSKEIIIVEIKSKVLEPRTDNLIVTAGDAEPVTVIVAQEQSNYLYELETDVSNIEINAGQSSSSFTLSSSAPLWTIQSTAEWLTFSQTTGGEGEYEIIVTASDIDDENDRTAQFTITAEYTEGLVFTVEQYASTYPNYNTSPAEPDQSGMESSAIQLAEKIKIGWNIGNTLEAIGGETAWGNPKVSSELIQLVKQNGFNAIRIPCAWNQYLADSEKAEIKEEWLQRVKEVVQYCVDNDMYVLLNIHWDGGWLEENCTKEKQAEVNLKQKAYWQQIATYFRDFDEHLIFAGANEPNVESQEQMDVLMSYHQTFVDAVRSTGGKNAYRVLVIQGPSTDITKTNDFMNSMPEDEIEGRLMSEIHYYTPYQFCLMTEDASWGKMFYYWGANYHSTTDTNRNATWGEEEDLNQLFASMKTKFVDKGIPVILGEFAAIKRTSLTGDDLQKHLDSRAYFLKYVVQKAKSNGLLPFYWDAGNMGENASALFNRSNNTVFDQQALDALMEGLGN